MVPPPLVPGELGWGLAGDVPWSEVCGVVPVSVPAMCSHWTGRRDTEAGGTELTAAGLERGCRSRRGRRAGFFWGPVAVALRGSSSRGHFPVRNPSVAASIALLPSSLLI